MSIEEYYNERIKKSINALLKEGRDKEYILYTTKEKRKRKQIFEKYSK